MSVVDYYIDGPLEVEIGNGLLSGDRVIDYINFSLGGREVYISSENNFTDPDFPNESILASLAKIMDQWLKGAGESYLKDPKRAPAKNVFVGFKGTQEKVDFFDASSVEYALSKLPPVEKQVKSNRKSPAPGRRKKAEG